MKKLILSLAIILASGSAFPGFAQYGPEWGSTDQEKRDMLRAYNFLNDNIKSKNYDKAGYYFQQLIEKAPAATVNIYIHGMNLYKGRINEAQDRDQKKIYVDSLMIVYDLAGAAFPDRKAQFTQAKAIDYKELNPTDRKGIAQHFRAVIEELGDQTDPSLIPLYFNELTIDFKNDDVSTEEYLGEFDRLHKILADMHAHEQVSQLDNLLSMSGAADCASLEEIYSPQIDADPENAELLEKTIALLNHAGCTDSEFYRKVAELFYKVKPSSQSALLLGAWNQSKGNYQDANKYFMEALASSTDPAERANISLSVAVIQLNNKNYSEAYKYARQIITTNANNAHAFYIMAMAQAGGSASVQDPFTRQTVYWLVVDNLQNARRVLAANPESAGSMTVGELDREIGRYQASFPTVEDLFFKGHEDGAGYTVNAGWITGQTTIRRRP